MQDPCPRCINAHMNGAIRKEAIMPLPEGADAPLDLEGNPCCHDCAAADTLVKIGVIGKPVRTKDPFDYTCEDDDQWEHDFEAEEAMYEDSLAGSFMMARTAVGNCRQEQFRLPGVPTGLAGAGYIRKNKPGDLEKHWAWQKSCELLTRMPT